MFPPLFTKSTEKELTEQQENVKRELLQGLGGGFGLRTARRNRNRQHQTGQKDSRFKNSQRKDISPNDNTE